VASRLSIVSFPCLQSRGPPRALPAPPSPSPPGCSASLVAMCWSARPCTRARAHRSRETWSEAHRLRVLGAVYACTGVGTRDATHERQEGITEQRVDDGQDKDSRAQWHAILRVPSPLHSSRTHLWRFLALRHSRAHALSPLAFHTHSR